MKLVNAQLFSQPPKAVIFDLDNTLYSYDDSHAAALSAAEAKLKHLINLPAERFHAAYGQARKQVKETLAGTAASHSRLLYFQAMLESLGLSNEVTMFLDIEQTYWRTFLAASRLHPDVDKTLSALTRRVIPIAIVTDLTAQIQFRKIAHLGLDHHLAAVVTTEEVGTNKAGLRPFTRAMEKLGLEPDSVVWSIGDEINDMVGAKKAINAVTIQKLVPGIPKYEHDASFSDFSELLAQIETY